MPCQDRRMRRLLLSGLMLVAVLAVPSLAAAKGQLLFSVSSTDVRVAGAAGTQRVSLPAEADLAWFTDRPARRSGHGTAGDLVAGWSLNGFNRTPPNAALVTKRGSATMQTIVTLRNPVVADGRVSFAYRVLGDHRMLGMRTTGRPLAGRYRGELFVDDATVPPCAQLMQVDDSAKVDCIASTKKLYNISPKRMTTTGSVRVTVRGCASDASNGSVLAHAFGGGNEKTVTIDVGSCAASSYSSLGDVTSLAACTGAVSCNVIAGSLGLYPQAASLRVMIG